MALAPCLWRLPPPAAASSAGSRLSSGRAQSCGQSLRHWASQRCWHMVRVCTGAPLWAHAVCHRCGHRPRAGRAILALLQLAAQHAAPPTLHAPTTAKRNVRGAESAGWPSRTPTPQASLTACPTPSPLPLPSSAMRRRRGSTPPRTCRTSSRSASSCALLPASLEHRCCWAESARGRRRHHAVAACILAPQRAAGLRAWGRVACHTMWQRLVCRRGTRPSGMP